MNNTASETRQQIDSGCIFMYMPWPKLIPNLGLAALMKEFFELSPLDLKARRQIRDQLCANTATLPQFRDLCASILSFFLDFTEADSPYTDVVNQYPELKNVPYLLSSIIMDLNNKAACLVEAGDVVSAIQILTQFLSWVVPDNDLPYIAAALLNLLWVKRTLTSSPVQRFNQAALVIKKIYSLKEHIQDLGLLARLHYVVGLQYKDSISFSDRILRPQLRIKTVDHFKQARAICKQINDGRNAVFMSRTLLGWLLLDDKASNIKHNTNLEELLEDVQVLKQDPTDLPWILIFEAKKHIIDKKYEDATEIIDRLIPFVVNKQPTYGLDIFYRPLVDVLKELPQRKAKLEEVIQTALTVENLSLDTRLWMVMASLENSVNPSCQLKEFITLVEKEEYADNIMYQSYYLGFYYDSIRLLYQENENTKDTELIWDILAVIELARGRQLKPHKKHEEFDFQQVVEEVRSAAKQLPELSLAIEWFCEEELAFGIMIQNSGVEIVPMDGNNLCSLVNRYIRSYIDIKKEDESQYNNHGNLSEDESDVLANNCNSNCETDWEFKKKWQSELDKHVDQLKLILKDLISKVDNYNPNTISLVPSSIMKTLPLHLIFNQPTIMQATVLKTTAQLASTLYKPVLISNDYYNDELFEHERDALGSLQFQVLSTMSSLSDKSVIQVSVHGNFDFNNRDNIHLLFSDKETEDGKKLRLFDLFNHNFNSCALVFLNACEAGIHDPSDDLANDIGIAGVIAQQSKCVIAPLWKIDEVSSIIFAVKFHYLLRSQTTKISIADLIFQTRQWLQHASYQEISALWLQIDPQKFKYGIPSTLLSSNVSFDSLFDWGAFACFGVNIYVCKDKDGNIWLSDN